MNALQFNLKMGRLGAYGIVYAHRSVIRQAFGITQKPKNQRKPEWVRNELIRLAALSGGSRRSVARLFNRLHAVRYAQTVSVSFTCDFLKRHAVQVLRLRREFKSKPPRIVPICHTWAMDLTFHSDRDGVTHANLGMIDHGSRALLCLQTLGFTQFVDHAGSSVFDHRALW